MFFAYLFSIRKRDQDYLFQMGRLFQELMIFVDDLLVFCGAIRQAPPPPGGGGNGEDFGQCIRCGPGQPLGSSSAEQVRPCQPEVPHDPRR